MWTTLAKTLRIGEHRKIKCCGQGPSAIINHNDNGISIYCFRCGRKEFEPHGPRSLHEIMATRRAYEVIERAASMPEDAVALMAGPPEALCWVLKGGLAPEEAHSVYGFCWHEPTRLVLIPLDRGLIGRNVHGGQPKYKMFGAGRSFRLTEGASGTIVVVEDVLSAIAVNRAGWASLAVLGTGFSSIQATYAASPLVVGWFDGDKAGDRAWVRLRQAMALYPSQIIRLRTDKDPKCIHRAEIVRLLERATCEK